MNSSSVSVRVGLCVELQWNESPLRWILVQYCAHYGCLRGILGFFTLCEASCVLNWSLESPECLSLRYFLSNARMRKDKQAILVNLVRKWAGHTWIRKWGGLYGWLFFYVSVLSLVVLWPGTIRNELHAEKMLAKESGVSQTEIGVSQTEIDFYKQSSVFHKQRSIFTNRDRCFTTETFTNRDRCFTNREQRSGFANILQT